MDDETPKRSRVTSFCMSDEEDQMIKRQSAIEDRGKGSIIRDALTMYCIVKGASVDCTAIYNAGGEA